MGVIIEPYVCHYVDEDIMIGGDFDKEVWKKAEPVTFYIAGTTKEPISKTQAGLLWSDKYLYCFFKAFDKDIFAYHTQRDSETCRDDVLELFFKTNPDAEPYYNFEINALNTVYDAYNFKRGAGWHERFMHWNCDGLKSAVNIVGTLNDYTDIDEYWQLEIAVPFSSLKLPEDKNIPLIGDIWNFHLARYDYSVYLPGDGVELSSCAIMSEINFHRFEDWNPLVFAK